MTDLRSGLRVPAAPPPVGGLEEVVRAGRRRRRVAAGGVGGAALAVVAGGLLAATSLGGGHSGAAVLVADPTVSATRSSAPASGLPTRAGSPSRVASQEPAPPGLAGLPTPGPRQVRRSPSPAATGGTPAAYRELPTSREQAQENAEWFFDHVRLPAGAQRLPTAMPTPSNDALSTPDEVVVNRSWRIPTDIYTACKAARNVAQPHLIAVQASAPQHCGTDEGGLYYQQPADTAGYFVYIEFTPLTGAGEVTVSVTQRWAPPRTAANLIGLHVTSVAIDRETVGQVKKNQSGTTSQQVSVTGSGATALVRDIDGVGLAPPPFPSHGPPVCACGTYLIAVTTTVTVVSDGVTWRYVDQALGIVGSTYDTGATLTRNGKQVASLIQTAELRLAIDAALGKAPVVVSTLYPVPASH